MVMGWFQEWWELTFGNAYKVELQVGSNLVKGIWLKATKNIRPDGILYLHGGQFDIEVPNASRFSDAISYRVMGYHVLMLKFPEEDEGGSPNPNLDILEIKDAPDLFRSIAPIDKIHIITVSRGGLPGTLAFQLYPNLFGKIICMCPPLWTENQQWFDSQSQWAKDYLKQRLPSPMVLAQQGAFAGLQNRMMMIGGAVDTTCPPNVNSDKFAKTAGIPENQSIIVPGYGHNVAQSSQARSEAMRFIGK
jgi:hypothetical protein